MKKLLFFFTVIFLGTTVYAQQDPEAKKILDKLSEKTKSHKTISAEFKVTFQNIKDNIQNTSEGSIIIKSDKYVLKFMGNESYFNGVSLWSYLPDVNEVNISEPEPDDEDIFNNPRQLFTIYESNYKYQLINLENEFAIVDLYPTNLNEDFSRIRLQINTEKYFLSSATIFGKDGSHYTIEIKNYETNKDFDDSFFEFTPDNYPDIEIIDLR